MVVLFRVDASLQIGSGHVVRCLTLAKELRRRGCLVLFVSREFAGNLIDVIKEAGFVVFKLPCENSQNIESRTSHSHWLGVNWQTDAEQTIEIFNENEIRPDWVIIDHYAIDEAWERKIRPYTAHIMGIDDLADRTHDCDILLDQNYYPQMQSRYDRLLPTNCTRCIGPQFALLREEFSITRQFLRNREGTVRNIMIFFGGSDSTNETAKALEALQLLNNDLRADVIVGKINPHKQKIKQQCRQLKNVQYHQQIDNMAEMMARVDLFIGASGSTTWERYCLGLPAVTIAVAMNQIKIAEASAYLGVDRYLGESSAVSSRHIADALTELTDDKNKMMNSSAIALKFVDGKGVHRISSLLMG